MASYTVEVNVILKFFSNIWQVKTYFWLEAERIWNKVSKCKKKKNGSIDGDDRLNRSNCKANKKNFIIKIKQIKMRQYELTCQNLGEGKWEK